MKVLYITILATAIVAHPLSEAADSEENELSERFFDSKEEFRATNYNQGFNQGYGGAYDNGLGFQPYGYQPGSGFGGADVAFTNTGPLGRPALSYQAPGMSINLREKGMDKREAIPEADPRFIRPVSTSLSSASHTSSYRRPGLFRPGAVGSSSSIHTSSSTRPGIGGFHRPGLLRPTTGFRG
ncbi:uncharacterized protein LOC136026854 [Artemia franciscana]|uniref:uncharacterized protein LOC136026854 n=1 Tax=Artemia franciscana TaxID=6661 RepID=UPI0032DBE755